MLKKLVNYFLASRKNAILSGFLIALFVVFFPTLVSSLLVKFPFFSKFSISNLSNGLTIVFIVLVFFFFIYMFRTFDKEERQDKEKMANRTIADFEQQYPTYVSLVKSILQKEEYQNLDIPSQWIKQFEIYLFDIAPLRKDCFTDFEIAACLMFAVTPKLCGTKQLAFAFECAKEIICEMKCYSVNYLSNYRLQLEEIEAYSMLDFSIPDKKLPNEATLSLLGSYLSLRSSIYSILPLADFLRILYLRQQKLQ